jgi:tripartite-type tricarboxylate transporter receptor subunit TctC
MIQWLFDKPSQAFIVENRPGAATNVSIRAALATSVIAGMWGIRVAASAASLLVCIGLAAAQTFPTRSITIIVPYTAGGAADLTARFVAEHMSATLGQPVVVENVTGGGGIIATGRVIRSVPDGHTLLVHQLALAASVSLYPRAPFNAERDLAGVGLINYSPMMIVGRTSLVANSMSELIPWMKQSGQRARFAHTGAGSSAHLCAALFANSIGAQIELIPYRGAPQALSDIVAGHVDLYCTPPSGPAEYVKTGTAKGYAIVSRHNLPSLPGVPSLTQVGLQDDLEIRFWQGMYAPSGTPKPIIEKLNAALRMALADEKVVKRFDQIDFTVFSADQQTPAAADSLLRSEITRWGNVIRANHIEAPQQ